MTLYLSTEQKQSCVACHDHLKVVSRSAHNHITRYYGRKWARKFAIASICSPQLAVKVIFVVGFCHRTYSKCK